MSRVPPLWLALVVALWAPATITGAAPESTAAIWYTGGFDAEGDFVGGCQSVGVALEEDRTHRLVVAADQAEMRVYRTWVNETYVGAGGPFPVSGGATFEQHMERHPLPGDAFKVDVPADGRAFLSSHEADRRGALHVDLQGALWSTGPSATHLRAGPDIHYVTLQNGVWGLPPALPGPARWVETGQETYTVRGDGFLNLYGARVRADGLDLQLPPHRQIHREGAAPGPETVSLLYTRAVLDLSALDLSVPGGSGRVACGALDWSGDGAVTYRAASGTVRVGGAQENLSLQELTLSGRWAAREAAVQRDRPWGQSAEVDGDVVGAFAAGRDFVPVGKGPVPGPVPVATASALALLVAALAGWKWKALAALFTRDLKADPLDHPVRAVLHDLAHQAPGSNLADAVRITERSYSTVRHHARRLARMGLIATHEVGRQVHLHPPTTSAVDAARRDRLRDDGVRYAVQAATGGITLRALRAGLQEHFGRPGYWATRIIARAEAAGLVVRERTEKGVELRRADS